MSRMSTDEIRQMARDNQARRAVDDNPFEGNPPGKVLLAMTREERAAFEEIKKASPDVARESQEMRERCGRILNLDLIKTIAEQEKEPEETSKSTATNGKGKGDITQATEVMPIEVEPLKRERKRRGKNSQPPSLSSRADDRRSQDANESQLTSSIDMQPRGRFSGHMVLRGQDELTAPGPTKVAATKRIVNEVESSNPDHGEENAEQIVSNHDNLIAQLAEVLQGLIKGHTRLTNEVNSLKSGQLQLSEHMEELVDSVESLASHQKTFIGSADMSITQVGQVVGDVCKGVLQKVQEVTNEVRDLSEEFHEMSETVNSRLETVVNYVGGFDAHLAHLIPKVSETYQTYNTIPSAEGLSMREARELRAPLAPATTITTKTVLSQRVKAFQVATNMSLPMVFRTVPGLDQALNSQNEEEVNRLLTQYCTQHGINQ